MRIDQISYRLTYRFGKPRWDTGDPRPELERLTGGRPPGRALDLGCGTGADAVYLARAGWEVVGVDFAAEAIEAARRRASAAGVTATFVTGDVSRLSEAGVSGPFDLITDIGCYHALPERLRDGYAAGVAAMAKPGADLHLAGIADAPLTWRLLGARGVSEGELRHRFGASFDLTGQAAAGHAVGRAGRFATYHLIRR